MMKYVKEFFKRLVIGLASSALLTLGTTAIWFIFAIVIVFFNAIGIFQDSFTEIMTTGMGGKIFVAIWLLLIIGDMVLSNARLSNSNKELFKEIDRFSKSLAQERQLITELKAKLSKRRKR